MLIEKQRALFEEGKINSPFCCFVKLYMKKSQKIRFGVSEFNWMGFCILRVFSPSTFDAIMKFSPVLDLIVNTLWIANKECSNYSSTVWIMFLNLMLIGYVLADTENGP